MMISTGFAIFNRHVIVDESAAESSAIAAWLENAIQSIVDGDEQTINAFLRTSAQTSARKNPNKKKAVFQPFIPGMRVKKYYNNSSIRIF